ncbi:MAG: lipid-A-disaccharide synthase [Candidatus Aminicenantes bacterium]|nr:lipid-A-disaccharide synthase [Candidatus Aminicenantes bacterium]
MRRFLIVAGEKSGENYGAAVVRAYRGLDPKARFFGVGGRNMAEAGVDILVPMKALAVVGLAEVLSEVPRIRRILASLEEEARRRKPAAAVLIDSPDFNLRLAKRLMAVGVPVLYYIGPTVWAWRRGRLRTVRARVRKMCLIFPFEEEIYRKAGVPARFVGHPLLERVKVRFGRDEFLSRYGLDPGRPLISMMPGSRRSEVLRHLPTLVEAARRLRKDRPAQFLLLQAEDLDPSIFRACLPRDDPDFRLLREDGYEAMASSDLVLSACGTANLESALLGTPLIAFYRLSRLTYALGRPFVRIGRYSIVNILAGRELVPELIQGRFHARSVAFEAGRLLDDPERRTAMRAGFRSIRRSLGTEDASGNVARELAALAGERGGFRTPAEA